MTEKIKPTDEQREAAAEFLDELPTHQGVSYIVRSEYVAQLLATREAKYLDEIAALKAERDEAIVAVGVLRLACISFPIRRATKQGDHQRAVMRKALDATKKYVAKVTNPPWTDEDYYR